MKKIDRKSLGDIVISDVFEINMLMDFYKNLLSVKQQKVLSMYYDYDYSLTEIADQLDISKQAVSNNIKRAELRLRFFEKNLKLVKNFMEKKEKDEELKELFDPHNLSKSSSSFNQSKLEWLNQHYIKNANFERLSHELKEFDLNLDDVKHAKLLIDSIKERSITLLQMKEMANSILNKPQSYNEKAYKKFINENSLKLLASFSEILDKDMDALEYEELTNKFLEKNEAKLKDLAQPLRIAITGNSVSPSIFEVLEILGSDEVKQRIKNLINKSKEL